MIRVVAAALFWLGLSGTVPAVFAAEDSPQAILTEIYAAYGPDSEPEDVPGRFFAPDLLELYDEVVAGTLEGEVGIDFDLFIDAQDIDTVRDLDLSVREDYPGVRVIDAWFTVFDERRVVQYAFVTTPTGWKIDNMAWRGEGGNLRTYLTRLKAEQGR